MIQGSKRQNEIKEFEEAEKLDGSLERSTENEQKLMKTVIEDDEAQADGKLLNESINRGISFNSDIMFNNLVNNFKNAKKLYGDTLIRELTDASSDYVERNSRIPEFKRELKERIKRKLEELRKKGYVDYHGKITDNGLKMASINICIEELDKITAKSIVGDRVQEKKSHYGQRDEVEQIQPSKFRYRDLAVSRTVKTALRRGHKNIKKEDFRTVSRKSKGSIYVVYALDVSGSMRGQKLNIAKRSGIALSYKAINQHDKVGFLAFNSEIVKEVRPIDDFNFLVDNIINVKASKETNMVHAIEKSIELFPNDESTKHLILLTDAVSTVGENEQVMNAVIQAKAHGITISVVGINLTEGHELAQNITETSEGKLYIIRNLEDMDSIVLEDYYAL